MQHGPIGAWEQQAFWVDAWMQRTSVGLQNLWILAVQIRSLDLGRATLFRGKRNTPLVRSPWVSFGFYLLQVSLLLVQFLPVGFQLQERTRHCCQRHGCTEERALEFSFCSHLNPSSDRWPTPTGFGCSLRKEMKMEKGHSSGQQNRKVKARPCGNFLLAKQTSARVSNHKGECLKSSE